AVGRGLDAYPAAGAGLPVPAPGGRGLAGISRAVRPLVPAHHAAPLRCRRPAASYASDRLAGAVPAGTGRTWPRLAAAHGTSREAAVAARARAFFRHARHGTRPRALLGHLARGDG